MTITEFLNDYIDTTIVNLQNLRTNGVKTQFTFGINCTELDDFSSKNICDDAKHKDLFTHLKTITGPTLYWFEIDSNTTSESIITGLNSYKTSKNPKATPAIKSQRNEKSKILYVGKVKNKFWGRLIQHLGFFGTPATQGLQLFHWAKELSLDLKVNIIEFDDNMMDLMPIIEFAFAKRLEPLVGKHK